ncbi:MAG: LbtU family siderophore porin [Gammaproteobacteria bacterium]|nr:LbtU family siderophore porin [Gammaproteobacteria bacterium]
MRYYLMILLMGVGIFTSLPVNAATNTISTRQLQRIELQMQQLQKEVASLKHQLAKQKKSPKLAKPPQHRHVRMTRFGHFVTVTTSPMMGLESKFSPNDLLYSASSINEDLFLLKQRAKLVRHFEKHGISMKRPIVEISGGVEGQIYEFFGNRPTMAPTSASGEGINLSTAQLDVNAIAGHWANAFISLDYDNTPVSSGSRDPRGMIYLRRGFVNIGDLNHFPVYGTVGLMYLPFGHYSSGMISSPLIQSMGRVRTTTALLGLSTHGFRMAVFGYSGNMGQNVLVFKQGGADINYTLHLRHRITYRIGASGITNLADSQGMQGNGIQTRAGNFGGFGATATGNDIARRVPAVDFDSVLGLGPVTMKAEFLMATRRFDVGDFSFNGRGAWPMALHTEANWGFHIWHWPTSWGVAYGRTWQALGFNLPQDSISTFLNTSIWKDTQESLEYRHDLNYASGTANGRNATAVINARPGSSNTIIGQIGVYF